MGLGFLKLIFEFCGAMAMGYDLGHFFMVFCELCGGRGLGLWGVF
jgi:hypothetical protein